MESALEISLIDTEPLSNEFTSLADHAASTPASYSLDTDPILYYELNNALLRVLNSGLPEPSTYCNSTFNNRESNDSDENENIRMVNIKIASTRVYMWFPTLGYGYSIPYPSITMHGLSKGPVIYFQFSLGSGSEADFVEAYLEPPAIDDADSNGGSSGTSASGLLDQVFHEIYNALSTCANLHASPLSSDEDETGGIALDMDIDLDLPVPEAAAGGDDDGWTTSTNHHQDGDSTESNGKAGLEVAIDSQDVAVQSGVRRRRGDDEDDEDPEAEKWRRTS